MQTSDLQQRTLERLNENTATPIFYPATDVLAVLNLAQRIYAFLTLCLEAQRPFQVTPGNQWVALQKTFTDMILVLRCEWQSAAATGGGSGIIGDPTFGGGIFNDQTGTVATTPTPKLEPGSLYHFAAQSNGWYGSTGLPKRYHSLGFGLVVFDLQPDNVYTALITYARMPVALVNPTDEPEIPEPDHQSLVDFSTGFLRIREGGQELANEAPALQSFLTAVKKRAAQVRARSLAQRYDHAPPEIEMPDLSRHLKIRPDVLPARKANAWISA